MEPNGRYWTPVDFERDDPLGRSILYLRKEREDRVLSIPLVSLTSEVDTESQLTQTDFPYVFRLEEFAGGTAPAAVWEKDWRDQAVLGDERSIPFPFSASKRYRLTVRRGRKQASPAPARLDEGIVLFEGLSGEEMCTKYPSYGVESQAKVPFFFVSVRQSPLPGPKVLEVLGRPPGMESEEPNELDRPGAAATALAYPRLPPLGPGPDVRRQPSYQHFLKMLKIFERAGWKVIVADFSNTQKDVIDLLEIPVPKEGHPQSPDAVLSMVKEWNDSAKEVVLRIRVSDAKGVAVDNIGSGLSQVRGGVDRVRALSRETWRSGRLVRSSPFMSKVRSTHRIPANYRVKVVIEGSLFMPSGTDLSKFGRFRKWWLLRGNYFFHRSTGKRLAEAILAEPGGVTAPPPAPQPPAKPPVPIAAPKPSPPVLSPSPPVPEVPRVRAPRQLSAERGIRRILLERLGPNFKIRPLLRGLGNLALMLATMVIDYYIRKWLNDWLAEREEEQVERAVAAKAEEAADQLKDDLNKKADAILKLASRDPNAVVWQTIVLDVVHEKHSEHREMYEGAGGSGDGGSKIELNFMRVELVSAGYEMEKAAIPTGGVRIEGGRADCGGGITAFQIRTVVLVEPIKVTEMFEP